MVNTYYDKVKNVIIIDFGMKTVEVDVLKMDQTDVLYAIKSGTVKRLLEEVYHA